jgi:hypothetical protein
MERESGFETFGFKAFRTEGEGMRSDCGCWDTEFFVVC